MCWLRLWKSERSTKVIGTHLLMMCAYNHWEQWLYAHNHQGTAAGWIKEIHPSAVEIILFGPKWQTDQPRDQPEIVTSMPQAKQWLGFGPLFGKYSIKYVTLWPVPSTALRRTWETQTLLRDDEARGQKGTPTEPLLHLNLKSITFMENRAQQVWALLISWVQ